MNCDVAIYTQVTKTLTGHMDHIYCVAISPDGSLIASGSRDKSVLVWEAKTGRVRIRSEAD